MVVEDYAVAAVLVVAAGRGAAHRGEERVVRDGACEDVARLVVNAYGGVDRLDVVVRANVAVCVGRQTAVAAEVRVHARERISRARHVDGCDVLPPERAGRGSSAARRGGRARGLRRLGRLTARLQVAFAVGVAFAFRAARPVHAAALSRRVAHEANLFLFLRSHGNVRQVAEVFVLRDGADHLNHVGRGQRPALPLLLRAAPRNQEHGRREQCEQGDESQPCALSEVPRLSTTVLHYLSSNARPARVQ